ncbi:hypothetical protein EGW08_007789, partial [Elysia chlorotica]
SPSGSGPSRPKKALKETGGGERDTGSVSPQDCTSAPECPGLDDLDNLSVLSEGELSEEDDDNTISNLEAFYGFHDQEGDKFDDKLIQIVDAGLCKKPDEAKTKDLLEQYPKPVNSKNLRVPKTNGEVWKLLTKNQRLR